MRHQNTHHIALVVLGSIVTVLSSILINIITSQNSFFVQLSFPITWGILVTLVIVGTMLAVYDRLHQQTALPLAAPTRKRAKTLPKSIQTYTKAHLPTFLHTRPHPSLTKKAHLALLTQQNIQYKRPNNTNQHSNQPTRTKEAP